MALSTKPPEKTIRTRLPCAKFRFEDTCPRKCDYAETEIRDKLFGARIFETRVSKFHSNEVRRLRTVRWISFGSFVLLICIICVVICILILWNFMCFFRLNSVVPDQRWNRRFLCKLKLWGSLIKSSLKLESTNFHKGLKVITISDSFIHFSASWVFLILRSNSYIIIRTESDAQKIACAPPRVKSNTEFQDFVNYASITVMAHKR